MKAFMIAMLLAATALPGGQLWADVRIKDMARIQGMRDHALIGYGIVVGLAGSGDSEKNRATRQALVNTLKNFNVSVADDDLNSRNAAAVMITSTMRSYSEVGDSLDIQVSSLGDAKSLLGGTLLLTPLYGPDEKLYALAQGAVSVGGYSFELNGNSAQKNHPTVGQVPRGGTVERAVMTDNDKGAKRLALVLNEPDYTTAQRLADALNAELGLQNVRVVHAAKVEIPVNVPAGDLPRLIARIEAVTVRPDQVARVVVNERTGTVVAGANVRLSEVNVSHGDLNVVVSTKYLVSQPTLVSRTGAGVATTVVPDTKLSVRESDVTPVQLQDGATVGDLVRALYRVHLSTRDVITVLQAIKRAGALHAELVIQ